MAGRWSSPKQPQGREPMKAKTPAKKTLAEQVSERVKNIGEARREKAMSELKAKHVEEEDAMLALMYGPDWRTKDLDRLFSNDPPRENKKAS